MMRRFGIVCLCVAVGLLSANATKADDKDKTDSKWVMEAAAGGQMEVTLGKVAVEQAASADVKKFGQRMVDDHTKANKELLGIADKKGIQVSAELPKKHQAMVDKLSKLKGAEFDQAYMKMMLSDHEEDAKEFEDESKNGQDADVKAFAAKTLPVIKDHLKMAKDISGSLSK